MSQSSSMIYTQTLKHVWSYWKRGNAFLKLNSSLEPHRSVSKRPHPLHPSLFLPFSFLLPFLPRSSSLCLVSPTVATFVHMFCAIYLLCHTCYNAFRCRFSFYILSYFIYFLLILNFLFFALWATFFCCSIFFQSLVLFITSWSVIGMARIASRSTIFV